jgi:hypothetical protein
MLTCCADQPSSTEYLPLLASGVARIPSASQCRTPYGPATGCDLHRRQGGVAMIINPIYLVPGRIKGMGFETSHFHWVFLFEFHISQPSSLLFAPLVRA